MFARMSTLEGSPDQVDEGLRHVREQVPPFRQQQDGFKGFIALADRQSGEVIGVSLWESEQCGPARKPEIVRAATQRRSLARRWWA